MNPSVKGAAKSGLFSKLKYAVTNKITGKGNQAAPTNSVVLNFPNHNFTPRIFDPRQEIAKPMAIWTPDEVHDLVMDIMGVDEEFPRGYQVLVKLYTPSEKDVSGMYRTQDEQNDIIRSTLLGQILRIGADAFQDRVRFPMGATVTFGEWAVFRGSERQRLRRIGKDMAYINDDRFLGVTKDPEGLQTDFSLIHEYAGV